MGPRSLEPDMSAQVALARCDRYKPSARLEDDPGFLCIYVNPPEALHRLQQGFKQLANFRTFVCKVLSKVMVTTGMRHVARNEPLSALRTFPERPLLFFQIL